MNLAQTFLDSFIGHFLHGPCPMCNTDECPNVDCNGRIHAKPVTKSVKVPDDTKDLFPEMFREVDGVVRKCDKCNFQREYY